MNEYYICHFLHKKNYKVINRSKQWRCNRKFKRFFSDNNKLIYVQLITVITSIYLNINM